MNNRPCAREFLFVCLFFTEISWAPYSIADKTEWGYFRTAYTGGGCFILIYLINEFTI